MVLVSGYLRTSQLFEKMLRIRDNCTLSEFLTHKICELNDMVVVLCHFNLEGFAIQQQRTGASTSFQLSSNTRGPYHPPVGAAVHSS